MQISQIGDNWHEMSILLSWKNKKKYFKMFSAEMFTQHMKR